MFAHQLRGRDSQFRCRPPPDVQHSPRRKVRQPDLNAGPAQRFDITACTWQHRPQNIPNATQMHSTLLAPCRAVEGRWKDVKPSGSVCSTYRTFLRGHFHVPSGFRSPPEPLAGPTTMMAGSAAPLSLMPDPKPAPSRPGYYNSRVTTNFELESAAQARAPQ